MEKVLSILSKYHNQDLLKHKSYKRGHIRRMKALQKFKLDIEIKNEIDCFNVEMLVRCLRSKRAFEKVFFHVYTEMQDYWEHMNFVQRIQQIELQIKPTRDILPVFEWEAKKIYLPCFDTRFNRIYRDELVMLDSGPYRRCINDFKALLHYDLYGYHRYIHGFTSLQEVYHRDDYDYVLYQPMIHKFYLFKGDRYLKSICLELKDNVPDAILHMIGKSLLEEDEKELLEVILMCQLVNKKCQKALIRYVRKKGVL